jgi:gamma-glutamylputrescine oxidase
MHSISVWEKESFFSPKDVVNAGSGLVGLWCAYYLKIKNPKLSIAIIDRGIIPTGASTRNAGFACFGSVTELLEDVVNMSEEKMLQLVEMRYKGLARIQKVFKKKEIDFEICGGYELITSKNKYSRDKLKDHIQRLNKLLG